MFTKHTPPSIPSAMKITMKWALVSERWQAKQI